MNILSRIQLIQLRPLIMGLNYRNIHAALVEILSEEESFLFARVEMNSTEAIWYVEGDKRIYSNLTKADDELRDEILDYIAVKKHDILNRLQSNTQLAQHTGQLFRLPSQEHIFYNKSVDNQLKVVFTQWGMLHKNIGSEVDVIGMLLSAPRKSFVNVTIVVQYKGGGFVAGENMIIHIFSNTQYTTDDNGKIMLGRMKIGLTFKVQCESVSQDFVVLENQSEYLLIIPRFTSARIDVVNQYNEPLLHIPLLVNGNDYVSDEEGKVIISSIEYLEGSAVNVANPSVDDSEQQFSLELEVEKNHFKYQIFEQIDCSLRIMVMDENDKMLSVYPVTVNIVEDETNYITGDDGTVELNGMNINESIRIEDGRNADNIIEVRLVKGDNSCILHVATESVPTEPDVRIKLLNVDGTVMDGIELKIKTKKGEISRTTDSEGFIYLPLEHFTDGEKVIARYYVLKSQLKDGKTRQ